MAGVAQHIDGHPQGQYAGSAGPLAAADRVASRGQRAGDRGSRGAAGAGTRPRAHRGAGARRPGRHRTIGARRDSRAHLRRQPAASGQHPAAVREAVGRAIDVQFPSPPITPTATERRLGHLPGITGWTFGHHGTVGIGGHVIPAIGLAAGKGPLLSPTLLQGRPPRTGGEIVLGTSTLRQIGRHVGQTVTVTVSGHPLRQRIVGRAVFPNFGQGGFTPTDLGQGAQTTATVLQNEQAPPGFEFVLLGFASGPRQAANIAGFGAAVHGPVSADRRSSPPAWSPPSGPTASPTTPASTAPPRFWPRCSPSSGLPCSGSSSWCQHGSGAATSPS